MSGLLQAAGISYALIWSDDNDVGELRSEPAHCFVVDQRNPSVRKFIDQSVRCYTFGRGIGLPGRCRLKRSVEFTSNVQLLDCQAFLRVQDAVVHGIRAVFGVPFGPSTVVEFGSSAEVKADVAESVHGVLDMIYGGRRQQTPLIEISVPRPQIQPANNKHRRHPDKQTRRRHRRTQERQDVVAHFAQSGPHPCSLCGRTATVTCWHCDCRDSREVFCRPCYDVHKEMSGERKHWPPLQFAPAPAAEPAAGSLATPGEANEVHDGYSDRHLSAATERGRAIVPAYAVVSSSATASSGETGPHGTARWHRMRRSVSI
eukprot:TRINITY_DN2885_c2_g2_i1.p1 TRINITY_DN2885_c2_g2~~TRINITY_DN2885_c2_g2_i1.p1  ORF type:complete len:366 (+),score=27.73 TRINITY_DN2885_c2_g2_i1:153-1100(+)